MNGYQETGEIRQIIVITDGKSNTGASPVEAAEKANRTGLVVSTIGIVDKSGDEKDVEEVERIAAAGGGLCEYAFIEDLGRTVQLLTQKTAQRTIEQIISRQLKNIVGTDIGSLEPQYRFKIVNFIEKYGDMVNLKCVIVLDTSGSMKNKLETAKKSLVDLLESLKERKGDSRIAVISFPGGGHEGCRVLCGFTDRPETLREKLSGLRSGGGTPTGPAIMRACGLLNGDLPAEQRPVRKNEALEAYDAGKHYV